ncbi:inositol monophosphatase [Saitoella complicata NRRL Y-17804]|uniref:Inositol-1-monophosphatase n=1 Tax=Saitoella complicata (strain BCRC 22490 / CBS 7301 / JCM 7358 / NBRC 10748 / NRRL Y-17804) TaxID=698492 RepID=A0A0E9NIW2_SAICN|nr:inositol monophosphatase [Saitoella complicata NRRL Y-17804]ODQ54887.1 inositol monophosphatase [Saitoella complicata NRRL Y-17804]GAO49784.1 hypothetical protein G7K_3926-t1 [Saitoella complicata NRRL Y-17804]
MSFDLSSVNLQEVHDWSVDLARRAGQMMLDGSNKRFQNPSTEDHKTDAKKNAVDLVTEVDQAVEAFVISEIEKRWPSFKFIGEETQSAGADSVLDDHPTFIVDPIDGTMNFVHGNPWCAISIGLSINRIPYIGIIYSPFLNEMYTAIRNQGSYLHKPNQPPLRLPLQPPTPLAVNTALIITEWGADRTTIGTSALSESSKENFDVKLRTYFNLLRNSPNMVHGMRSYGAASLNLCSVAAGHNDAYWEGGCWEWDVCAGWVILHEAGGFMCEGNPPENFEADVEGAKVEEATLIGRKYLAIRGAKGGRKEQEDLAKWVWKSMEGGRMTYGR